MGGSSVLSASGGVILPGFGEGGQMGQPRAAPVAAGIEEARMPRPSTLSSALSVWWGDVLYHTVNLCHGVFDLACVVAVAALVLALGLGQGLDVPDGQARVIRACPVLVADCISAETLAPPGA